MRTILLAVSAAAAMTMTLTSSASAADVPLRTRVYAPPYAASYPAGLSADEIRDYQIDQMERRHEMEREALRFNQKAERRMMDPDDD